MFLYFEHQIKYQTFTITIIVIKRKISENFEQSLQSNTHNHLITRRSFRLSDWEPEKSQSYKKIICTVKEKKWQSARIK